MCHNIFHKLQVAVLSILDVSHPDYSEHQYGPNLDLVGSIVVMSKVSPLLKRMLLI